jgi:hypothetical protein
VDQDTLTMDKSHGIHIAYEMRIEQDNPVTKETTFNASKKTKKKNNKNLHSDCSCSDDSEEDEEMTNFIRNLKRGSDKYKGMFTLKFFDCGGIGNFYSKCPQKNKESDEEEDLNKKNKNQKGRRNKNNFFKKILCTQEYSSSSNEDEDSDSDIERALFMKYNILKKILKKKERLISEKKY